MYGRSFHSPQTIPPNERSSTDNFVTLILVLIRFSLQPVSLSRKESYKDQRRKYRTEKKRVARELLSTLKDPSVVVLADWLKSSHWTGTVLLNTCELIERPSKKDGFCFKLFHPLEQSIWATKGPEGETIGAMVQPLPSSHLIFRAPSQAAGKCWMDALELAVRCSSILIRSMTSSKADGSAAGSSLTNSLLTSNKWNESDYEKHFKDQDPSDESSPCLSPDLSPVSSPFSVWKEPDLQSQLSGIETTPSRLAALVSRSSSPMPMQDINSDLLASLMQQQQQKQLQETLPLENYQRKETILQPHYYRKLTKAIALADQELQTENRFRSQSADDTQYSKSFEYPSGPEGEDSSPVFTDLPDVCFDKCNTTNPISLKIGTFANVDNELLSMNLKAFELSINLDDASHTDEYEPQRESGHFSSAEQMSASESDSDDGSGKNDDYTLEYEEEEEPLIESSYVFQPETYIGDTGEQTEELAEENKSLIWFLLKQVRPGMDLSKVVLPTFILEPRSFLDKLSDYYYHADLLSRAVQEDDPFTRMKEIVRWYLSGFYKKPKGLKKPYNPILGETFRCYWKHPNGSRTFYVAEQVSHHPPVSAVYVTNRLDGFSVSSTILAKSKFYGNSTSAILDGNARLTLLPRGEDYIMNMPYAHCKGILMGTLTMELGGKVTIECEKTGYVAELEFKLKPFLSGYDANNLLSGKLKLGKETLATLEGRWDRKITFMDKRTGEEEILWEVTKEVKDQRLQRYTISFDQQSEWESERLWNLVSEAIRNDNQVAATEEKTILEEAQRGAARERKAKCEEWNAKFFIQDPTVGVYVYRFSDLRPWDPRTDLYQYEYDYEVTTRTRLKAPMIRTASIVSVELQKCDSGRLSTLDSKSRLRGVQEIMPHEETSSGEHDDELQDAMDLSPSSMISHYQQGAKDRGKRTQPSTPTFTNTLLDAIQEVKLGQDILARELKEMRREFDGLKKKIHLSRVDNSDFAGPFLSGQTWSSVLLALFLYSLLQALFKWILWMW
ncbi:Oxysterol-binding protein-related protein 8 [Armadillidium nasatum]|uniref:Oxysterol-binding protein n=1 Tax=Armadillidium nasatum TaxID=96803 RepID=A0A5N5TIL3_9CRUS|nr:Oxysterol-binding protein-related protein 8 [Armadillidium nasatum]